MQDIIIAKRIAQAVLPLGGRAYFVGGCVRDKLMNFTIKDIDIEIHGITPTMLESALRSIGTPITKGKSFGVYGLAGTELDIALPRKEHATGRRHKDFSVEVDPFIGTLAAARRRDFTIGALMEDVLSGEIIDHFGGREDLQNGILRHVDDTSFPEDPLRVLRAARFAARFGFTVAPETKALCQRMDLSALSRERVEQELKNTLTVARYPSIFFKFLREIGQLEGWFDELAALIGLPQNPIYHKEGDVWTHTLMVLDAAASRRAQAKEPYAFMLSALVHDFGKAITTAEKDGVLHAYGHENEGLPLICNFMRRLTSEQKLIRYALNMSELHMLPCAMAERGNSIKSTNRMFDRSVSPEDLILLALCDNDGRITEQKQDPADFLFSRLEIYRQTMAAPFVSGKDLINAGLSPERDFSEIIAYGHKLRLAQIPKDEALKQVLSYARKLQKR